MPYSHPPFVSIYPPSSCREIDSSPESRRKKSWAELRPAIFRAQSWHFPPNDPPRLAHLDRPSKCTADLHSPASRRFGGAPTPPQRVCAAAIFHTVALELDINSNQMRGLYASVKLSQPKAPDFWLKNV